MNDKIKVGDQREQTFNKNLRYERQKDYNIKNYELDKASFKDSENRLIYKNFNFSIFVDDACNADCPFCVAHVRYAHKNMAYKKPRITDDKEYLKRLEEVLDYIRQFNPSVSLTGGEPTLSPLIVKIIELIDKYKFRKRTITTNGTRLFKTINTSTGPSTVLEKLIEHNFDYINISRAYHDHKKNNEIMRFIDPIAEASFINDDKYLSFINKHIANSKLKPRLSCLLTKEGVSNVKLMKEYLDYFISLGFNNFIFREIMSFESQTKNLEIGEYCNNNRINLNDIWEEMENEPDFEPWLNLIGYYYYVEIYKYKKNITVASEAADINVQYKEKNDHPNIIYETAFHPNGNLCGSWVDNEDILDRYIIK